MESVRGGDIGVVGRTDIGGGARLEAKSAKGLSSSMKGEPLNGEEDPNPPAADVKSPPRGGELILFLFLFSPLKECGSYLITRIRFPLFY